MHSPMYCQIIPYCLYYEKAALPFFPLLSLQFLSHHLHHPIDDTFSPSSLPLILSLDHDLLITSHKLLGQRVPFQNISLILLTALISYPVTDRHSLSCNDGSKTKQTAVCACLMQSDASLTKSHTGRAMPAPTPTPLLPAACHVSSSWWERV